MSDNPKKSKKTKNKTGLRLLRIRALMKKKRPPFVRVESWRYKRVKKRWRAAKGIDSKTRQKLKSGVKSPNVGYRVPKKVRGLHPSGLIPVNIVKESDLEGLNPKIHGIYINRRLGGKKRLKLVELATQKGFKVFNIGGAGLELPEYPAAELTAEEE